MNRISPRRSIACCVLLVLIQFGASKVHAQLPWMDDRERDGIVGLPLRPPAREARIMPPQISLWPPRAVIRRTASAAPAGSSSVETPLSVSPSPRAQPLYPPPTTPRISRTTQSSPSPTPKPATVSASTAKSSKPAPTPTITARGSQSQAKTVPTRATTTTTATASNASPSIPMDDMMGGVVYRSEAGTGSIASNSTYDYEPDSSMVLPNLPSESDATEITNGLQASLGSSDAGEYVENNDNFNASGVEELTNSQPATTYISNDWSAPTPTVPRKIFNNPSHAGHYLGSSTVDNQGLVAGPSGLSRAEGLAPMIGDLLPFQRVQAANFANGRSTGNLMVRQGSLKFADNQFAAPVDRIYYTMNYFENVNASINRREGLPSDVNLTAHTIGLEKTIWDRQASLGVRLPIHYVNFRDVNASKTTSTSIGDLSAYFKLKLLQSDDESSVVSVGLQVTAPTGSSSIGDSGVFRYNQTTRVQPFIGHAISMGRMYFQGFTALDIPLGGDDALMLFNDFSANYWLYRDDDPYALISAIIPSVEVHVNTPLSHRGYSATDDNSAYDVINMTFGGHMQLFNRVTLSGGFVTPLTGPNPFDYEIVGLVNVQFGGNTKGWGMPRFANWIR